jgi:hypothetical protein
MYMRTAHSNLSQQFLAAGRARLPRLWTGSACGPEEGVCGHEFVARIGREFEKGSRPGWSETGLECSGLGGDGSTAPPLRPLLYHCWPSCSLTDVTGRVEARGKSSMRPRQTGKARGSRLSGSMSRRWQRMTRILRQSREKSRNTPFPNAIRAKA